MCNMAEDTRQGTIMGGDCEILRIGNGSGYIYLSLVGFGALEIGVGTTSAQSATLLGVGTWRHIAIERSPGVGLMNPAMLRVYCDGVEVIATQVLSSPSAAEITFSSGAGLTFVSILVDEFRLSDGLIYNGSFTPPDEPFTYTARP